VCKQGGEFMFFILNKPKIYSYLIVLSTVMVLFFTASVLSQTNELETMATGSNSVVQDKPIDKIDTDERIIAITINCLESDDNIENILEYLSKNNIKVTFCISGEWVVKYPEITKRIDEQGHNIANMSEEYKDISALSYEDVNKNIKEGENKLSSLLNKKINLFRCPCGKYGDNIMRAANDNGYTIIGYNIDTLDYSGIEASVIWDNIKTKITNGSIISMNSNAQYVVEELELIITSLKEREYRIVTIDELLNS